MPYRRRQCPPRPTHLVDGKSQEIDVDVLDIHSLVGDGLSAVEENFRAVVVGQGNNFFSRESAAGQVGAISHADQTEPLAFQLLFKRVQVKDSVGIRIDMIGLDQTLFLQPEPGDKVRVVFFMSQRERHHRA